MTSVGGVPSEACGTSGCRPCGRRLPWRCIDPRGSWCRGHRRRWFRAPSAPSRSGSLDFPAPSLVFVHHWTGPSRSSARAATPGCPGARTSSIVSSPSEPRPFARGRHRLAPAPTLPPVGFTFPSIDISEKRPLPPGLPGFGRATSRPLDPVPSSWFRTTSTACSASCFAGLLHPAADPGVRRVSARPRLRSPR